MMFFDILGLILMPIFIGGLAWASNECLKALDFVCLVIDFLLQEVTRK